MHRTSFLQSKFAPFLSNVQVYVEKANKTPWNYKDDLVKTWA